MFGEDNYVRIRNENIVVGKVVILLSRNRYLNGYWGRVHVRVYGRGTLRVSGRPIRVYNGGNSVYVYGIGHRLRKKHHIASGGLRLR